MKLINYTKWTVVVGDDVQSSHRSERAAAAAAARERKRGRRAYAIPPGQGFEGSGWACVEGVTVEG
jgi:hypothetical protein